MLPRKTANKILAIGAAHGITIALLEEAAQKGFAPDAFGRAGALLQALFAKAIGFSSIRVDSPDELLAFCLACATGVKDLNALVLTVGLGGSECMPSIRFPAVLAAPIRTVQQLVNAQTITGIKGNISIRIFKADNIACIANQFDRKKVQMVTHNTGQLVRAFFKQFFPEIGRHVLFESDTNWLEYKEPNDTRESVRLVEKVIRESSRLDEARVALARMGQKYGGTQGDANSILYAAAHPFYNRAFQIGEDDGEMFKSFEETPPDLVIDFGGRPQKLFADITHSIRGDQQLQCFRKPALVDIFVSVGKVPVYYLARGHDLEIGANYEDFKRGEVDYLTEQDYVTIDRLVGWDNYWKFLCSNNFDSMVTN